MSWAEEPLYGYRIARLIENVGEKMPKMKQGALYPVLRSLESAGLLSSRVDPSISGPPRRYYTITELGREILGEWKDIWHETKGFIDAIIRGESHDNHS
ncbi:MAG: PadR family transcriptional regulator [Candidatus Cloacimonetes bacterium]|nr:PadR family transcriptional regulator [Candidatus Cloacimonadota bacterium]